MSNDILARLRAFYEGLVRGDLGPADALFNYEQLVMHEPPSLPYGGDYRGKQGLQQGIAAIATVWKHIQFSDLRYSLGEDIAIVTFTMHGVSRATGKKLAMPVCEVWRFCEGRAVDVAPYYWDTHAVRGLLVTD